MKLVLLEALIVMIATRAVLSLLGQAPPWPSPVWDFFAVLALVATASLAIQGLMTRFPRAGSITPPRIPLERIGPYRQEQMQLPVRHGAPGTHDIHLN